MKKRFKLAKDVLIIIIEKRLTVKTLKHKKIYDFLLTYHER